MSGNGISWAICKSAPCSRQITVPAPHHSSFLQAGCPSCRPTNSVKALKAQALKAHIYQSLMNKTAQSVDAALAICTPVTDVVGRQRLRSATQQQMVVPRHRLTTVGRRAFAVPGLMVWKSLPDDLHAQQDYESFRHGLKTWLFSRY